MKIDSEHLEILAMIVEMGGLTEGAEALGKSQPSVSRTMQMLEYRLGAPLFEPGRRPLRPTELGEALARIGSKIHHQNAEAEGLIDRYRLGHAGRLRIGGTPIFMDGVITPMIADFHQHHPDVRIEQSYGYGELLASGLRNGSLDLAIVPQNPGQVGPDLAFTPLLAGRNVVACRAGHPLTRRSALTQADILAYPWITPPNNSPLYQDLLRALTSIGAEDFRIGFSGGTFASIVSFLKGSDALTVLPYSVVFVSRKDAALAALPLKIEHPDRRLGLLSSRAHSPSPALKLFVGFVTNQCRQLEARMLHDQQVTKRRG
ncbi:MAG: LysR family transcriptional regulator [bacterium]